MVETGVLQWVGELGDSLLVKDMWRTCHIDMLTNGPDGLSGCPWASLFTIICDMF